MSSDNRYVFDTNVIVNAEFLGMTVAQRTTDDELRHFLLRTVPAIISSRRNFIAANAPRADVPESLPRWIFAQGVARVVPTESAHS